MSAATKTIHVKPGGTITVKGAAGQLTTIHVEAPSASGPTANVQAPSPAKPTVNVHTPGTSGWTLVGTAAVALVAAWLGQAYANHKTRERDREARRLVLFENLINRSAEVVTHLGHLASALDARDPVLANEAIVSYNVTRSQLDAAMALYGVEFGTTDATGQALKKLEPPLGEEPGKVLDKTAPLAKTAAIVRERQRRFQVQVAAVVISPREWEGHTNRRHHKPPANKPSS